MDLVLQDSIKDVSEYRIGMRPSRGHGQAVLGAQCCVQTSTTICDNNPK